MNTKSIPLNKINTEEKEKEKTEKEKEKIQQNPDIDNILNDLEYYMFTSLCIDKLTEKKEIVKEKEEKKEFPITKQKEKEDFFSPRQKDGLFWCFYVIKNGETSYELLNNEKITLVKEKKIKIDYVDVLRNEKSIFKKQSIKFPSLTHIENDLVNEQVIDIRTFLSLCHLEKLNVLYVSKKTYFEMNENEGEPIHLIKRVDESNKMTKYLYQGTDPLLLEKYRMTLYKIENIEKPIKAITAYKVADLIDFSIKLSLETSYHDEKTAKIKNKSKQALYEAIVQVIG